MEANMTVRSHLRDATGERLNAQVVVVSDFDMPFMSMVSFMVKLAFAMIPAGLILGVVVVVATAVFGAALFGPH